MHANAFVSAAMIFIFGQSTKGASERPLLDTHCYPCRKIMTWDFFRLTEWMSVFFVRVLPIKSDYYLVCQGCKDVLELTADETKAIKRRSLLSPEESKALHDRLVQRLEAHQLSGKTETQRAYLKTRE